ncbi:MAG TPA: Hint domain-containing protein, partial [Acidocella sp.]|nr:Hint domain-containing protein [Acidocella sp.]
FSGAGAVANLGTIEGNNGTGVVLAGGGSLVNGASTNVSAFIYGNLGGVSLEAGGTVVNYGRIVTSAGRGSRNGVGVSDGGLVVNSGEISGFNGIGAGTGTVENSGQISGGSVLQIAIPFAGYTYVSGAGIVLVGGTLQNAGTVKGGSILSFPADHVGTAGAGVTLDAGLVVNSGSISGGAAVGYALTGGTGVLAVTGTVTSNGRISGGTAYHGGDGLMVLSGAYVQNSGTIQGGAGTFGGAGVLLEGGTLQNNGSIAGGDGTSWNWAPGLAAGVDIYTGLFINNGAVAGGAQQHVGIDLGVGTLRNFGTISGAIGVLEQSGFIENEGFIQGAGVAVEIWTGTLVNAGTLAGHYAVYMTSAAQKLVADPGAAFQGRVVAKGTAAALELANGTGTLDMGTSFSGFATIALDQGGSWDLAGGIAQLAGGEVIAGFKQDDTLELEGFTASSATYVSGLGLELSNGASMVTLGITGGFPTYAFTATPDATGTRIAICYARGTRIMTVQGERPVEALDIGDELPTYFAGAKRVKWVGRQRFTAAELKGDRSRLPVRIKAGALCGGLPRRDLVISPGHSVLIDGVLVLAKCLVNGITITQDEPVR